MQAVTTQWVFHCTVEEVCAVLSAVALTVKFCTEVVDATLSEGFLVIYVISGITFQRIQDVPISDPLPFFFFSMQFTTDSAKFCCIAFEIALTANFPTVDRMLHNYFFLTVQLRCLRNM